MIFLPIPGIFNSSFEFVGKVLQTPIKAFCCKIV